MVKFKKTIDAGLRIMLDLTLQQADGPVTIRCCGNIPGNDVTIPLKGFFDDFRVSPLSIVNSVIGIADLLKGIVTAIGAC